jgi:hypothetical protein
VHEQYGGSSRPVALTEEAVTAALRAMAVASAHSAGPLDYGRVDLMRYGGRLVISELELVEPGLYLDVLPANAEAFADLLMAVLAGEPLPRADPRPDSS